MQQVLRNHAGEIEREEKREIANACVSLGLRVLSFLYDTVNEHGDEMLLYRARQIRAEKLSITEVDLADEVANFLPSMVSSITVGAIIKIANALGSESLVPTMDSVLSESNMRQLVKITTQLEHFSDFPNRKFSSLKTRPCAMLLRFKFRF